MTGKTCRSLTFSLPLSQVALALVLGLAWVAHAAPGYDYGGPGLGLGGGPGPVFGGGSGPVLGGGPGPVFRGDKGLGLGGGVGGKFGGGLGVGPGPVLGGGPGPIVGGGAGPILGGGGQGPPVIGTKFGAAACNNGEVLRPDGVCQQPLVTRKVFVYQAPKSPRRYLPAPPVPRPRVLTNVLFIRPEEPQDPPHPIVVPAPRTKHIVYVLNKRRQHQQKIIRVPPGPQEKPEVYFVHYKDGENPILKDGTDLRSALGGAGVDPHNIEELDDLHEYGGTQISPGDNIDDIGDFGNLGGVGGIGYIGDPTGISGGYGKGAIGDIGGIGIGGGKGGIGVISGGYSNNVPDITLAGNVDIVDDYGGAQVLDKEY